MESESLCESPQTENKWNKCEAIWTTEMKINEMNMKARDWQSWRFREYLCLLLPPLPFVVFLFFRFIFLFITFPPTRIHHIHSFFIPSLSGFFSFHSMNCSTEVWVVSIKKLSVCVACFHCHWWWFRQRLRIGQREIFELAAAPSSLRLLDFILQFCSAYSSAVSSFFSVFLYSVAFLFKFTFLAFI